MSAYQGRCLGHLPLHGGWALLRCSDPAPPTTAMPGQPLTVSTSDWGLTLPVYQRHEDSIGVLVPPAQCHNHPLPARDTPVTLEWQPTIALERPAPNQRALILGMDGGLGGALALASWLAHPPELVIVGARTSVPARPRPSRYMTPRLPPDVIAGLPQLEEQGIPSRIALNDWQPGCFDEGAVTLLLRYLAELDEALRKATVLYAFVPAGALDEALPGLRETLAGVYVTTLPEPA